ncbi:bacillithiol biosynthesis deacetylase BshB1 [Anoxybacter fermentans]|uniref:Bacillithiol biosynthesis deacetylase BshB1 n=1 Tax=Anoxybacter fermentans TaxID=1323375 RepID=A0A3Q9HSP3_9FIRM|nr:bacillithiol biosynthesis deacetylase BshB1 [Anoxybacter fermentans]
MLKKADILAFGPHPDDVELNIGGILALHAQKKQVVVVDLTEGEMGSNGSVEIRRKESQKAAQILNLKVRENLYIPDGEINPHDLEQQKRVVAAIRRYQPDLVLLPYWEDRHPDHAAASRLIEIAIFKSGLKRYLLDEELPPYRPSRWYYYLQHQHENPNLVVDVSSVYARKMEAIRAYKSQFDPRMGFKTYINQPIFLQKIEARDQYFGAMVGVKYGEGLIFKPPLSIKDLFQL